MINFIKRFFNISPPPLVHSHLLEDGKSYEMGTKGEVLRTHHFKFCRECGKNIKGIIVEGKN